MNGDFNMTWKMSSESDFSVLYLANFTESYTLQLHPKWTQVQLNESGSGDNEVKVHAYLDSFNKWYQGVHGYLSAVVCIFGILSNIINIVVLTRKSMLTSTNCILTAIAVADMLTMLSYLPFAVYFYCLTLLDAAYGHSRGWIFYMVFHFNFTITCHTVAMWLTVVLAIFRYIVVCHHLHGPTLCNIQRALTAVAAVVFMSVILCLPTFVLYKPTAIEDSHVGYWVDRNSFITQLHIDINFWLFGVVLKVAPCILLSLLSLLLILAMRRAGRNRQRLRSTAVTRRGSERNLDADQNRTTWMLVAVVLSFVAAEMPQGIISLLSGVYSEIFETVYVPLGDVWDILVLVNSAVNFVLYCTMSRQYRMTFKRIFLRRCLSEGNSGRSPVSNTRNGVAYTMINLKSTVPEN